MYECALCRAIELSPDGAEGHAQRSSVQFILGQMSACVSDCSNALHAYGEEGDSCVKACIWARKGDAEISLGNEDAGLASFVQSLALSNDEGVRARFDRLHLRKKTRENPNREEVNMCLYGAAIFCMVLPYTLFLRILCTPTCGAVDCKDGLKTSQGRMGCATILRIGVWKYFVRLRVVLRIAKMLWRCLTDVWVVLPSQYLACGSIMYASAQCSRLKSWCEGLRHTEAFKKYVARHVVGPRLHTSLAPQWGQAHFPQHHSLHGESKDQGLDLLCDLFP